MTAPNGYHERSWVSLLLALSAMGLLVSGVLSFGLPYSPVLSGIHTWFGLVFIFLLGFHLKNNLRSLVNYSKKRNAKKPILTGSLAIVCILAGVFFLLPPFSTLLEFGYKLRKTPELDRHKFVTVKTRVKQDGRALVISLRAGPHYESEPQPLFLGLTYRSTPQMAFWLEDESGNYLESLYVTGKIAESRFRSTDLSDNRLRRRPEALPYWSHKRGIVEADGLTAPRHNTADLDGITGATPQGHYDVSTKLAPKHKRFKLMMEINRSYDFNKYYHRDRFPDDAIYSGSGSSGQPSIIYSGLIDIDSNAPVVLVPVGHGHYSGKDGLLYTDMTGIDTALQLLDYVIAYIPINT